MKRKVLCLSRPAFTDAAYLADFEAAFELHWLESSTRAGLVPELAARVLADGPFDAALVRMGTVAFQPFDQQLLGPLLPHCRLVASASAGYDEFDVPWMTAAGVCFCNSRHAVAESTADMALFLVLAVLKNADAALRAVRAGRWRADLDVVRSPRGMVLGIVGMGSIGRHLAVKAAVFGMQVRYFNRTRLPAEREGDAVYCATLDELLAAADVVSVNCPLTDETRGLLGREQFARMKDGVYLVNTARGAIVDETALIDALESGKVCMAGLDVFADEPDINPYFMRSERCFIQPHLGGYTDDAFRLSERECFENIKAFFATGVPISPVNHVESTEDK